MSFPFIHTIKSALAGRRNEKAISTRESNYLKKKEILRLLNEANKLESLINTLQEEYNNTISYDIDGKQIKIERNSKEGKDLIQRQNELSLKLGEARDTLANIQAKLREKSGEHPQIEESINRRIDKFNLKDFITHSWREPNKKVLRLLQSCGLIMTTERVNDTSAERFVSYHKPELTGDAKRSEMEKYKKRVVERQLFSINPWIKYFTTIETRYHKNFMMLVLRMVLSKNYYWEQRNPDTNEEFPMFNVDLTPDAIAYFYYFITYMETTVLKKMDIGNKELKKNIARYIKTIPEYDLEELKISYRTKNVPDIYLHIYNGLKYSKWNKETPKEEKAPGLRIWNGPFSFSNLKTEEERVREANRLGELSENVDNLCISGGSRGYEYLSQGDIYILSENLETDDQRIIPVPKIIVHVDNTGKVLEIRGTRYHTQEIDPRFFDELRNCPIETVSHLEGDLKEKMIGTKIYFNLLNKVLKSIPLDDNDIDDLYNGLYKYRSFGNLRPDEKKKLINTERLHLINAGRETSKELTHEDLIVLDMKRLVKLNRQY